MEIRRLDQVAASILVVDRDPLMLTAMASILDMQGHRALLARTEDIAQQAISENDLDLIILAIDDLNAGCEFAQRLRSSDKTRDVPVIFLVPQLSQQWQTRLHAHGGVYSLLQPVDPHALIDLVERAIWMPHVANAKLGAQAPHLGSSKDWVRL